MNGAAEEAVEVITNSHAGDMPAKRLRTLADEETQSLGHLVYPPAARKQFELNAIERDRLWINRIRSITCEAAAMECRSRGNGLVLSISPSGQLHAQRISMEDSVLREFVPDIYRRGR